MPLENGMTEQERRAYNAGVNACMRKVEDFAAEYVRRWGGGQDAKAAGWAILQAAAELRSVSLPGELVANAPGQAGRESD